MNLRQEQIVFLAALVLLGFLSYRVLTATDPQRRTPTRPGEAELTEYSTPDVALALPSGGDHRPLQRDLLSPPSDTRPLPLLGIVEPPRAPLIRLFPPPEPGPAPAAYGQLLRRDLAFEVDPDAVASLFGSVDGGLGDVDYDFEFFQEPGADDELTQTMRDAVEDGGDDPLEILTPQELALVRQRWMGRYDWYYDEVKYYFGRIENPDRYGLKIDIDRVSEPLLFVEIDPQTGTPVFGNQDAIPIDRERTVRWDFAATLANQIEVERLRIGDEISRSLFGPAMALADICVRGRLEAERALPMAEELYKLCSAFDPNDPEPRLGLARCYEAGFDFERAFAEYNDLRERFPREAEVHANLGLLEARFFLDDQAEATLLTGLQLNRGSWQVRWALGRFLSDRGRWSEALEHLEGADRSVPNDPAHKDDRMAIRIDLASAKLATGDLAGAHALFGRALSTEPENQRARAGWLATAMLAPADAGINGGDPPEAEDAAPGLELLLARGLEALLAGEFETAREQLESAAEADPLRANLAWRALSYLAETTGFGGEAQRYIDQALECDPTDAWALYQAGRLLAADEDYASARTRFLAALDQDLNFVDALAALGEMAYRMGDFEDAERYLERATALEPQRPDLHGLRGLNFLLLATPQDARASFEAGLRADADDELARAGLAWCTYLAGDSQQAKVSLRELDDSLRDRPDDDPMRVWAQGHIDRIQDHEQKVEWSDLFEREGAVSAREWEVEDSVGPVFRLVDGSVRMEGTFNDTGLALLQRVRVGSLFVSMEADVWVDASSRASVGLMVYDTRRRSGEDEILSSVSVHRHYDGGLQVEIQRQGQSQPTLVDMEQPFPTGRWVRLRIERVGDDAEARATLLMDGVPLVENAPMAALRAQKPLNFAFFARGEPGREVQARVDNFKLVYREGL